MDGFIQQNHFNSGKISLLYVDAVKLVAHQTFCDEPTFKSCECPQTQTETDLFFAENIPEVGERNAINKKSNPKLRSLFYFFELKSYSLVSTLR